MKAHDFQNWMNEMGFKYAADIVRCLGVSRNHAQQQIVTTQAGEPLTIKKSLAMAMSAAQAGLMPWPEQKDE